MQDSCLDNWTKSGYTLATMRYEIVFAPEAVQDLKRLSARDRAIVREAIEEHLRHEPERTSRSRIKRLRGVSRPQYRLRVGQIRVSYDITGQDVEVLAIVLKSQVSAWLDGIGEAE